jgi:hypothetical protein
LCTCHQENASGLDAEFLSCEMKSREAPVVWEIHVRSGLNQQPDCLDVTLDGRVHQGSAAIAISHIHVTPCAQTAL